MAIAQYHNDMQVYYAAGIMHGGDYTSLCTTSALCRSVDFELEKVYSVCCNFNRHVPHCNKTHGAAM